MAIVIPTKKPPLITSGYSMSEETRDLIAAAAAALNCSASGLVVAVMTDYIESNVKLKRGR